MTYDDYKIYMDYFILHGDSIGGAHALTCMASGNSRQEYDKFYERFISEWSIIL